MKFDVERFLFLTALLSGATPGCSSSSSQANDSTGVGTGPGNFGDDGATSNQRVDASLTGAGGDSVGGARDASLAGAAGNAGSGQSADARVDVHRDAGPCFSDTATVSNPADESKCIMLPFASITCVDDAGAEGGPVGLTLCFGLYPLLLPTAFNDLVTCLNKIPVPQGVARIDCASINEAAVACENQVFNRAGCPTPPAVKDGGSYGCAEISASCPAQADVNPGISVEHCQARLSPLLPSVRQSAVDCYLDPAMEGANCADKFDSVCTPPPPVKPAVTCQQRQGSCALNTDCCAGLTCSGYVPSKKCLGVTGSQCTTDRDCSGAAACRGGKCTPCVSLLHSCATDHDCCPSYSPQPSICTAQGCDIRCDPSMCNGHDYYGGIYCYNYCSGAKCVQKCSE